MTVRSAELWMAIATALLSAAFMYKSTDGLAIGWIDGKGPGSGAWPFWLSTGMLLASLWTLVRWFRGTTPESRSNEPYMTRETVTVVGTSAAAILVLLAATHFVGLYASLLVFLLFYFRFLGRHRWRTSIVLTVGIPVFVFCLFEWALTIPLPKEITEPLFYPIYDLIY